MQSEHPDSLNKVFQSTGKPVYTKYHNYINLGPIFYFSYFAPCH